MAVDAFLKIEGVKGESHDSKHKDEIDVLSWTWGMAQSGSGHVGGGSGAGKVSMNDIHFTKSVDSSSPTLMKFCCDGKHFPKAMLTIRKAGGTQLEYIKVHLEQVLISSFQVGGANGDAISESVSLNFSTVKYEYQQQGEDGAAKGGPVSMGYDLRQQKTM